MMSRMCFALLVQVAVVASTESCLAGDAECASDSSVLIQQKVVTAHEAESGDSHPFWCDKSSEDCKGDWPTKEEIAPKFLDSMTLTAVVEINGVEQKKGALAAFIGDEIRGIDTKPLCPPFGPHKGDPFYHLMVHGGGQSVVGGDPSKGIVGKLVNRPDSGKKITYKFRACDGTVTELEPAPSSGPIGVFKINGNFGNVIKKIVLKPGGLPPCQDNDAALSNFVSQWGMKGGCKEWKGYCLGLHQQMGKWCQATCKDMLHLKTKKVCS